MAKPKVEVEVEFKPPLAEMKRRFEERLDELGGNTGKGFIVPNKKASIFLDRWVQQNFRTEGGKVGGWLPFKHGGRLTTKKKGNAQGISSRRYVDASAKLLQDTSRLKFSFLPFATPKDAGIGSHIEYSIMHHKGTKDIPARRLLPLHSEVDQDLWRIYSAHVAGLTRKKL